MHSFSGWIVSFFHFCIYLSTPDYYVYIYTVIHSWVGWWVLVYFTGMNVFGSFSL